ncbi:hypothetical protein [Asticcacaulis solisilvae]|uniref:hypothetical protein n=1 Tax=Asticcacaulis solisilvae TaxID=1217274 RepID=UPI003FD7B40A
MTEQRSGFGNGIRMFIAPVKLWWSVFPLLIGVAVLFAVVTIGAVFALTALTQGLEDQDVSNYVILGPMILGHVLFTIFASRVAGRALSPAAVQPLGFAGWTQATLALSVLASGVIALTTATLHMPASMASVVVLTALLACTPLLPRLALKVRGGPGFPVSSLIVALPWLCVIEVVGLPMQSCTECWGLMEGGVITIPLLGLHLFLATTTAAVVSATVYLGGERPARVEA